MSYFVNKIAELGTTARDWLDSVALGALLLLAVVFRAAAARIPQPDTPIAPYVAGAAFLIVYFLHRYQLEGDDFSMLLLSLVRTVLAYHIVWSGAAIFLAAARWGSRSLRDWRYRLHWKILHWRLWIKNIGARLQRWRDARHPLPAPPKPPPPPPPPRSVRLRTMAEAAQADYDAEVAALAGLPLDQDEREALHSAAKQRLIRRLSQGI